MNTLKNHKILFFGKKNDVYSNQAFNYLKKNFPKSEKILTENKIGEKKKINYKLFDALISFKTKIIFKKNNLEKLKLFKINFHTSLPKYPGSCGVNFCIYNNDKFFGVTVHNINENIDNGKIILIKKRKMKNKYKNVASLIKETYKLQLKVFKNFIKNLSKNSNYIEVSSNNYKKVKWSSKVYKISDLHKLREIKKNYSRKKIDKIIRSTLFKDYKPYIKINNKKIVYNFEN